MFGVYLNGFWHKGTYKGVDTGEKSGVPKLVGLFPSHAEAETYLRLLDDDATDDWTGDYEIATYRTERFRVFGPTEGSKYHTVPFDACQGEHGTNIDFELEDVA